MRCSTLELGVARRLALRDDGEVVQHQFRRLRLARAGLAADDDGLVSPRLLERREGVLGLLEAVGRQAAVGRVVVAADDVVAVDGEPPAFFLVCDRAFVGRARRRRRRGASTPSDVAFSRGDGAARSFDAIDATRLSRLKVVKQRTPIRT